ncbi:hypothetical protein BLOT_009317 [Blomia tropicalis]|nr:hypothetical protein BLOT_009317 [Blomia tropicalis]
MKSVRSQKKEKKEIARKQGMQQQLTTTTSHLMDNNQIISAIIGYVYSTVLFNATYPVFFQSNFMVQVSSESGVVN